MKRLLTTLALGAAVAVSAPAMAVTITVGAINAGPEAPSGFATGYKLYTFDDGVTTGITGGAIKTSTSPSAWSQPAGDSTAFYVVGPSTSDPGTVAAAGFNKLSLYWGSIDTYNTITFLGLGAAGVFTGGTFDSGVSAATSRTVTFQFTAAEAAQITGVQFTSNGSNAFEFDNLVIGNAVPEPASWAMMIGGFGLVGGALRSNRKTLAKGMFARA